MSDSPEMSNNSNKTTLNIPSYEQMEKLLANQSKQQQQLPNLFKSKRTEETADSLKNVTSTESPCSSSIESSNTPNSNTTRVSTSNAAVNTFRSNVKPPSGSSTTYKRGAGKILVRLTQQKNPILKHIHNVPWEPSEYIKADFVVGQTTGIAYLSLRYHRLYPTYIYDRLAELKDAYVGRILLVYVDIDSYHDALREINRIAILSDFTLMLAWSLEEAARYLETYKSFEFKGPDLIRERVQDEFLAKITDCLTNIKSVNKTDVLTLLSTFGSLKQIADAKTEELAMCPGFGEQKVKRLQQAWKQPFFANKKSKH